MNGPASPRVRAVGWVLALAAVVALVVIGAKGAPRSGLSDDRLYALAGQMKCLQCAGESVAGSQADIAVKMRTEIRSQMRQGRTDDEILSYFADRYGQRVLLNPAGAGISALVWIIPVVVVGVGAVGIAFNFGSSRRRRAAAAVAARDVSTEDRAVVEAALAAGPRERRGR